MAKSASAPIIGVIQARMTSIRCPGKVLHKVKGRPLLDFEIERLLRSKKISTLVVATSAEAADDPIAEYCAQRDISSFRGDLLNVAGRIGKLLDSYPCRGFVRISGDSPSIDPLLVDQAIEIFEQGECDLATNIFPRTFPKGQSVEVIEPTAFRGILARMHDPGDFEHVTPLYYRENSNFRIKNFSSPYPAFSGFNLSIDSAGDMRHFERVVAKAGESFGALPWFEIAKLYEIALKED